jgi:hypothetical protein
LQESEGTAIAAHPVQHLEYNLLIKLPGRFLIWNCSGDFSYYFLRALFIVSCSAKYYLLNATLGKRGVPPHSPTNLLVPNTDSHLQ